MALEPGERRSDLDGDFRVLGASAAHVTQHPRLGLRRVCIRSTEALGIAGSVSLHHVAE